jgi:putative ABC transport system permease protein
MFFTYLGRELRRRSRQALVIALGLALGIGLTIAVSAASAGVKAAQNDVLKSLYGVGTDITVTQTATRGSGGAQTFGITGQSQTTTGTKTTTSSQDTARVAPGSGTLASTTLTKIQGLSGVSGAVGSLSLTDFDVSGKLSQTFTQQSTTGGTGSSSGTSGTGSKTGGTGGGGFSAGAPSGNFSFNQTTMEGVDVSNLTVGPMSSVTLSSGRELTSSDATSAVAVVNSSYATQDSIKVGSTETLGGTKFTVVGIVTTSSSEDYFIPLAEAQKISSETGKVTTVYVEAASSTDINSVASEISKTASGSTVSTSAELANSVSGSLSSTASLANNLGKWLSIGVLIAAFLVAALFTMSAVGRRTREFGTLKAIGWTSRRVVRQVLGESIVTGLIGGAIGIGIGYAGAFAIDKFAPTLTASSSTSSASNTAGGFPGGGGGGGGANSAAHDITVHLTAPVDIKVLLLAVGLAILGGLIAGGLGGWRASSLRPADALSKVA